MHVLTQASETLSFPGLQAEPVPSILRGFSAPVILEFDYSDEQLLTLLAHDTDPFNRWEAGQRLARESRHRLHRAARTRGRRHPAGRPVRRGDAHASCAIPTLDAAFKELVLTLPAETYIAEQLEVVDPAAHPRRARSDARAAGAGAVRRLGSGPTTPTGRTAPTGPIRCRPAAGRWPGWR